jgi:hypothetical protein
MKKISTIVKAAGLLLGVGLSAGANANLIVNGGFEDNNVATGSWQYYSANQVNGWEGSNIEIWDHLGGVVAPEGNQHAELNAHPNAGQFSIYQTFTTVVGQLYDVSFFYSARQDNSESFQFSVGSLDALINDHVVGTWNQYVNVFRANSTSTTLRFTSVTPSYSTVGNLIDGVNVTSHVPEPAGYALLALGIIGLGLARHRAV